MREALSQKKSMREALIVN